MCTWRIEVASVGLCFSSRQCTDVVVNVGFLYFNSKSFYLLNSQS